MIMHSFVLPTDVARSREVMLNDARLHARLYANGFRIGEWKNGERRGKVMGMAVPPALVPFAGGRHVKLHVRHKMTPGGDLEFRIKPAVLGGEMVQSRGTMRFRELPGGDGTRVEVSCDVRVVLPPGVKQMVEGVVRSVAQEELSRMESHALDIVTGG